VSGPPTDGFAVADNSCAETVVIESRPAAIKERKAKKRESMFIGKDEVSKLPLNKSDATPISSVSRHSDDHIPKTPLSANFV